MGHLALLATCQLKASCPLNPDLGSVQAEGWLSSVIEAGPMSPIPSFLTEFSDQNDQKAGSLASNTRNYPSGFIGP